MPEKTKHDSDAESAEKSAENCESDEKGNWSEDQKEKSYYYDDAYGYEVYNPDDEEEEENC